MKKIERDTRLLIIGAIWGYILLAIVAGSIYHYTREPANSGVYCPINNEGICDGETK